MPKQVIRLIIAFAIFVSLFLIVRHFLTPKSFGKYGHYRGQTLEENTAKDMMYADPSACAACHDDIDTLKNGGVHKFINCQTCHGPGNKHIDDPEKNKLHKPATRKFCAKCHYRMEGRPSAAVKQVDTAKHNVNKNCVLCHNPHSPFMFKNNKTAVGKDESASCTMCHSDIDKIKSKGMHKTLVCQNCHGAGKEHMEKPSKENITKPGKREFCGSCHGIGIAPKKAGVKMVDLKEHNTDDKCINCHIAHNPLEFK